MTSSLRRSYFLDAKLKERALIELVRAFETGRLIAFVGSMATESLGYGSWNQLIRTYLDKAKEIASQDDAPHSQFLAAKQAVDNLAAIDPDSPLLERRAALSLVKEALATLDEIQPLPRESRVHRLENAAAETFGKRKSLAATSVASPVKLLASELAIRRFATLNYDVEIEAELMVEPGETSHADPEAQLMELIDKRIITRDPQASYRLSRLMANGIAVESDVRDRERPDRMIEFAVGSADVDHRIMHLHGRAMESETMIVSLRDYDRLYRKDDIAKLPFEHGQRILFAGNPILFVGAGMTEPEVNETLRDFVSNNPHRRFAPTFLLWNTASYDPDPEKRATEMWLKRVDFLQRLGVLTIFDEDLQLPADVVAEDYLGEAPAPKGKASKRHPEWAELDRWLAQYRAATDAIAKAGERARRTKRAVQRIERSVRSSAEKKEAARARFRARELELLAGTIPQLARAGRLVDLELSGSGGPWRSLRRRFAGDPASAAASEAPGAKSVPASDDAQEAATKQPIALWGTLWNGAKVKKVYWDNLVPPGEHGALRVVIADAGSGKGSFAWHVAKLKLLPAAIHAPVENRMIVNTGYAFDTDFLLLAISRFLLKLKGQGDWCDLEMSRERQFDDPDVFALPEKGLVIINGMERFFTVDGAPLSAELDHLLRRIAAEPHFDVRWLFLGTARVEQYFRNIAPGALVRFSDCCDLSDPGREVNSVFFGEMIRRVRDKAPEKRPVATAGAEAILRTYARGSPHNIRRAVLGAFMNAKAFREAGIEQSGLALEILRAMAFIGAPVEAAVLLHVPRIRSQLSRFGREGAETLLATLEELRLRDFVIRIAHFEDYPGNGEGLWQRFGLHTAVSAELRHQFGVPLSESKLSTSFNMSLYVAQPVDGFVPEAAIRDELGRLIDHLIGAYKDVLHPEEGPNPDLLDPPIASDPRCSPVATATLRAALSVVRGYHSTTSLLTIDSDARAAGEDRTGVLLEHAERLETLLSVYKKLRRARHGAGKHPSECGPEPFYPDDLVWIHNELGVVYLAQGDLYSARRSFQQAQRVNREWVEFGDNSHNWRRITMNQVLLEIERAQLAEAERKLEQIENSINSRPALIRGEDTRRFRFIRCHFGSAAPAERSCFHPDIMHEEILMAGLVLGHRALCHHLRGHMRTAEPLYADAIAVLRRLGEHRGYAFFQVRFAQLHKLTQREGSDDLEVRLAVTAAEAVRQMDIAYHARIIQADRSWHHPKADVRTRRRALRHLTDALAYAAAMDLHRVRVDAGMLLARLKLESGDYETALDHATEAMALAARYGLSLRKISLRLDIGQILIRRGDPRSGAALIDRATEAADRFGYQRAVETAQRIRVEEDLSAVTPRRSSSAERVAGQT